MVLLDVFVTQCGTRIMNLFDPNSPAFSTSSSVNEPMVFFPNTLCSNDQINLPELFKAKFHNNPNECVLDLDLLLKNINKKEPKVQPAWKKKNDEEGE